MKMMKFRRIILYQMDGVSAVKIRSFNSDIVNEKYNKNIKPGFIDDLYEKSHVMRYTYGYDMTRTAMYILMTGQSPIESPISVSSDIGDLTIRKMLADEFEKKGYKMNFFSNFRRSIDDVPFSYKGYKHQKKTYYLKDVEVPASFWFDDDLVLFIHDSYTHDRGDLQDYDHHMTSEEYDHFINRHHDMIRQNLEFLRFDPDKDLLVFYSDHGLTLDQKFSPEGKNIIDNVRMAFDNDRMQRWVVPGQEIKTRVMFMLRNNSIDPFIDDNVYSLGDGYDMFLKMIGIDHFSDKAKEYMGKGFALSQAPGIYPRHIYRLLKKVFLNDRYFQFIYVEGKGHERKKWIYQLDLKKGIYYDLKKDPLEQSPEFIKFKQLPQKLRDYIDEYKSSRISQYKTIIKNIKKRF